MGQGCDMESQEKPTKATLTCHKMSHPFQNRTLILEGRTPLKIGRSSMHFPCAPNNALFECVVISRDHARLWYENGKFFLQDSKSSNGTFVNNELIGEKNKESPPTSVYSGDVIQFGSAVFSPDMKSRLGAIVALLTLYLPDGTEYPTRPHNEEMSSVPMAQLQQLSSYLREAEHREDNLRKKLSLLEDLVGCTSRVASEGWRAQVMEDQLLTKVAFLQKQLEVLSDKDLPEDPLRSEMANVTASICRTNEISKHRIDKALQEKTEAIKKSDDLIRSQENLLNECAFYKSIVEQSQDDLKDLGQKYSLYFEKYVTLSQSAVIDKDLHDKYKMLEQENKRLAKYADKVVKEKEAMERSIKSLQKDKALAQGSQSEVVLATTKKDVPESDVVLKRKFSVTLVNQGEEAADNTSLDGNATREGHSQVELMFQRFQRIEQVENIKVEKLKNIKQRLDNLSAQYTGLQLPSLSTTLKECLDEIGAELSVFLAESNSSSNTADATTADNTKHFNDIINNLKSDNTRLTSQITEMIGNFKYFEAKKDLFQTNLKVLTLKSVENAREIENLNKKLVQAQTVITSKNSTILELQRKTFSLEKSCEEDSQVIEHLQFALNEEQIRSNDLQRELKEARETLKLNGKVGCDVSEGVGGSTLSETLFEQKCVIEQMQANLAGVERERAMFGDLVKELAETKQVCAMKHEESAILLKKIQVMEANVDPVVAYFIPIVVALMFLFAVILFTNRRPVASVREDAKLPE